MDTQRAEVAERLCEMKAEMDTTNLIALPVALAQAPKAKRKTKAAHADTDIACGPDGKCVLS